MEHILDFKEARLSRWWRLLDRYLLFCISILLLMGLWLASAASVPLAEKQSRDLFHFLINQMIYGVISFSVLIVISMLPITFIRRIAIIGCFIGIIALIALPFWGSSFGKGAIRWYDFGFITVQPSEFIKPAFIIFTAWLFSLSYKEGSPPGKVISLFTLIFIMFVLVKQPDYGQALILFATWLIMFFVSGANWRQISILMGVLCLFLVFSYSAGGNFANRINNFLQETPEARTQIDYAIQAIKEGGIFGVGVGEGQVKWNLPDAHTDFIIAVAAEEYGLVSVFFIIGLFTFIVIRTYFRLREERDLFIRIAGVGLVTIIGLQAFVNMSVSARLLPPKGMTLPLISYGGSSLLASCIAFGCILAFTSERAQGYYGEGWHHGR